MDHLTLSVSYVYMSNCVTHGLTLSTLDLIKECKFFIFFRLLTVSRTQIFPIFVHSARSHSAFTAIPFDSERKT
jgi:hypothetical protein